MLHRRLRLAVTAALLGALLVLFPAAHARAQELQCDVNLNYQNLSGTEYTFLDELEGRVEEYMNQRSWTDDRFRDFERIDCDMNIIIQEALSLTEFNARLTLVTRRPIYGTTQSTLVTRFNDPDWRFTYTQGQPLISDVERYDPLTSLLDFYAYVMLGYDYDTFSELGGTPHFEQARRIVEIAESNGAANWSKVGATSSRAALVRQLLDPRFRPLRRAYFTYHLDGLDRFVSETEEARDAVFSVLENLRTLTEESARQYALDVFFNTKATELAAVFEGSPQSSEAYTLLTQIDPAHDYQTLVE